MGGGASLFSTSAGTLAVVALILALLALGGVVLLLARQQRLLGQYQHLMTGTSGGNLEQILQDHISRVQTAVQQVEEVGALAQRLKEESVFDLQHVGVVRFNPFSDTGGDQSFAIALADARGDGVLISSLHARDTTRVYAKPMIGWGSAHSLTNEEKQAIERAQTSRQ
jgi:hypothetical protein